MSFWFGWLEVETAIAGIADAVVLTICADIGRFAFWTILAFGSFEPVDFRVEDGVQFALVVVQKCIDCMSGHLVFGWLVWLFDWTHTFWQVLRMCQIFFRFILNKFRHLGFAIERSEKVTLIRITIPSRECEFPPLKNKNLLVDFLYIVPTIFDWECEELTINILTDIVFDFDFVVGDCCNHAKNSNSDWKRCKAKNEFIFRECFPQIPIHLWIL